MSIEKKSERNLPPDERRGIYRSAADQNRNDPKHQPTDELLAWATALEQAVYSQETLGG
jgi:hypothetical protein